MANDDFNKNEEKGSSELSSLISNAIENKKILDTEHKAGANTQSMVAQRNAAIGVGAGKPKAEGADRNYVASSSSISSRIDPVEEPNSKSSTANKTKKKAKWSKKKKAGVSAGIVLIVLFIVIALILGLFFYYIGLFNRNPNTDENTSKPPLNSSDYVDESNTVDPAEQEAKLKAMLEGRSTAISNENVLNILLIGEDLRDTTEESRGNTDVMLLISINKEKKKIVMSSFMRDEYVYLDGYGGGRLNAAYWYKGIPLLESTIEDYFNVNIDRYAMVNFKSFIDIVDTIGGIEMDVKEDELAALPAPMAEQNNILGNASGTDYLSTTGKQLLNGNQALGYARIRYGCGDDFGRTQRQREVISEIINKSKSLNLIQLNTLITTVASQTTTDITSGEIASLILEAFDFMNYDIVQVQVPADGYYTGEIIDNMDVLVPDYDANAAILSEMIYGDSKTEEEAIKKLENGELDYQPSYNNYDTNYNYNDNYGYGY